jgi:signal transduction histidine kinase
MLCGLVFLAAGAGLLTINYALLDHSLPSNTTNSATGQDVINRAAKLADPRSGSKITDKERSLLQSIASLPPDKALRRAATLPKPVAQELLKGLPSDVSDRARSDLLRESVFALAFGVAIAVALGWYVAGRALRPLQRITATARNLSHDRLDLRIALDGPDDELKELADTFDEMLARLDAAFASQRRFVADASHELRTPLTIMRTEIDVTLRQPNPSRERLIEMAHIVRDAIDRSERLVASLLALATTDHGLEDRTDVDLGIAVRDAVQRARPAVERRHLRMATEIADGVPAIEADPGLIDRLLDNLLDNAVRYNRDGGDVQVRLVYPHNDGLLLVVANTGEPIAPAVAATLLDPFRRAARRGTERDGFGLGLAIVRSITRAHGGEVTVSANDDGGGLTIAVTMPACRADGAK